MALCHLWKVLANRREMPEDWRIASVTLVFKKGKKEDPGNYRPVLLTSVPGKVMEQLVLDAISRKLEVKKAIRSSQHGFTSWRSRSTNLVALYNEMTELVDVISLMISS